MSPTRRRSTLRRSVSNRVSPGLLLLPLLLIALAASLTLSFSGPPSLTFAMASLGYTHSHSRRLQGTAATRFIPELQANAKIAFSSSRAKSTVSDPITVQAAGRGNPLITLGDGHDLQRAYTGPKRLTAALEQNLARPLALASADFDEDGVPDLVSAYAGWSAGMITLHRGNVDAIYPNSPEAKQRKAMGTFTDSPFLSPALVFEVPEAPDFLGAGDFDADGHWDVVVAARGGELSGVHMRARLISTAVFGGLTAWNASSRLETGAGSACRIRDGSPISCARSMTHRGRRT